MTSFNFVMHSPVPQYRDELSTGSRLAPRSSTLDGKVVGLLPNWRPSAVHLLTAVGAMLRQRYQLKDVVLEQPVREVPISTGNVIDGLRGLLDSMAQRVDVVITASGDWGSCSTWCSHVTPALEQRGIPTVMIATNTFAKFARRMASTQGFPHIVIAETPNPIRQLSEEVLQARVAAMSETLIEGLTLAPEEIERRLAGIAQRQIHPEGVVRSGNPV